MNFHRFSWIFTDFHGFRWIFIDFDGFQWIFVNFVGFLHMFHEFCWISMDFHESTSIGSPGELADPASFLGVGGWVFPMPYRFGRQERKAPLER